VNPATRKGTIGRLRSFSHRYPEPLRSPSREVGCPSAEVGIACFPNSRAKRLKLRRGARQAPDSGAGLTGFHFISVRTRSLLGGHPHGRSRCHWPGRDRQRDGPRVRSSSGATEARGSGRIGCPNGRLHLSSRSIGNRGVPSTQTSRAYGSGRQTQKNPPRRFFLVGRGWWVG